MNNIYLKLLEEFEQTGLSYKKSISPFMIRNFRKPTANTQDEWYIENEGARLFIRDVHFTEHFDFNQEEDADIGWNSIENCGKWYDKVNVSARITIKGLRYLETHQVNKSTSTTNVATIVNFIITIALAGTAVYFTRANLILSKENASDLSFIKRCLDTEKMQVSKLKQQYLLLQKQLSNTNQALKKQSKKP